MTGRGFTLIELLVTVAVAAVLVSFAVPAFQRLLAAERGAAAINQMVGAVKFARAQAIIRRHQMVLCPASGGQCLGHHQWHQGAMVFEDRDGDGEHDAVERVIRELPRLRAGERVYWRSFKNLSYLRFLPRGYTDWQNGNFLYCAPDNDPKLARMTILNAAGRLRMARDGDGDGIIEDAGGDNVTCPP